MRLILLDNSALGSILRLWSVTVLTVKAALTAATKLTNGSPKVWRDIPLSRAKKKGTELKIILHIKPNTEDDKYDGFWMIIGCRIS